MMGMIWNDGNDGLLWEGCCCVEFRASPACCASLARVPFADEGEVGLPPLRFAKGDACFARRGMHVRCWSGWSLCGVVAALNFDHPLRAALRLARVPFACEGEVGLPPLGFAKGRLLVCAEGLADGF